MNLHLSFFWDIKGWSLHSSGRTQPNTFAVNHPITQTFVAARRTLHLCVADVVSACSYLTVADAT